MKPKNDAPKCKRCGAPQVLNSRGKLSGLCRRHLDLQRERNRDRMRRVRGG